MSLRLSELVPEGYDYWYYHEPTGLVLHNNSEYGWVAVASFEAFESEAGELLEALTEFTSVEKFADPSDVLPLPDEYEP